MNRDYTFKITNTISFIYDSRIENIISRYKMTLQAASNVILPLLNSKTFFLKLIREECLENTTNRVQYVSWDDKKQQGTYLRYPEREELNAEVNESLIVEFYNR